jgi:hypothetical protein
MTMLKTFASATLLVLAGAPALASDPAPATPVADTKPVDCVNVRDISSTDVRSDSVIDFKMRGNKIYRNTLPHSCPGLGFARAFSYKTSISQLCSVDIITVLQTGGGIRQGASCGLGKFVPISKEDAKAKVEDKK